MTVIPAAESSAEGYEKELEAFVNLPEGDPEVLAEGAPVAPAQTPAQPAADEEAARAKAEIDALMERLVPATDAFPKLFHGRPMRDLIASLPEKDRYITDTRTQLAQKHDELIAAQAAARVLFTQLQTLGGVKPSAEAAPAADDSVAFYSRHGIKDPFKDFTTDPMGFMARVATAALKDARAEIEPLKTRFEPLERTVTAGQDERNLGTARSAVDRAFEQICTEDKIVDPAMRKAARDRFDRLFGANGGAIAAHVGKTADIYNPASWHGAYRGYEQAVGGFPPLLSVAQALPPSTKANPPVSTRSTSSVVGSGGKVVSKRRSEAVQGFAKDLGLPAEWAALAENEIADGVAKGLIGE